MLSKRQFYWVFPKLSLRDAIKHILRWWPTITAAAAAAKSCPYYPLSAYSLNLLGIKETSFGRRLFDTVMLF